MSFEIAMEYIQNSILECEDYPIQSKTDPPGLDVYIHANQWELLKIYDDNIVDYYLNEFDEEIEIEPTNSVWEDKKTFFMTCPYYGDLRFHLETEEETLERRKVLKKELFQEYDLVDYRLRTLRNFMEKRKLMQDFHQWKVDQIEEMFKAFSNLF